MHKTNPPCTVLFSGSYEITVCDGLFYPKHVKPLKEPWKKYAIEFLCQAMVIPHMTHKQHKSDSKTENMFCKDSTLKNHMSGNTGCRENQEVNDHPYSGAPHS